MTGYPFRHNDREEEESFKELFETYLDKVHDYIRAITKSHYLAEEVAQELFLILWKKRNELDHVENRDQYIFRMARNLAINQLKKAALDSTKATEFYTRSVKEGNPVIEQLNQRNLADLLEQAISTLPPQPQKVYSLSRKQQMNFDEIAAIMGLSRNTVKNHLNKALNDIRSFLIGHGYHPVVILVLMEAVLSRLLDR